MLKSGGPKRAGVMSALTALNAAVLGVMALNQGSSASSRGRVARADATLRAGIAEPHSGFGDARSRVFCEAPDDLGGGLLHRQRVRLPGP